MKEKEIKEKKWRKKEGRKERRNMEGRKEGKEKQAILRYSEKKNHFVVTRVNAEIEN